LDKEEKEILNAIKKGHNSKIFGKIYEKVFSKVEYFIVKNGGGFEDAKDVFQDGVLVFYKNVRQGKYSHDTEIAGYIFSVCRNLWYTKVKRKDKFRSLDEIEYKSPKTDYDASQDVINSEREQYVNTVFKSLGEVCAKLLRLSFYEKLRMKEICEEMGFANENSAKTKNYKCKQRLIKLMKDNREFKAVLSD
jgi:RNA polymerase sigma factor (sigma-70 family)